MKLVKNVCFLLALLLFFGMKPVSAQQSATTTAPDTRNPQPTQSDLIESEANVQNSSGEEVLREPGTIRFEGGEPREAVDDDTPSLLTSWLIVFGCFVVLAFAIKLVSRKPKRQSQTSSKSSGKKGAQFKQSYNEPIMPGTKKTFKSSSKKKKRRSKKKSKK